MSRSKPLRETWSLSSLLSWRTKVSKHTNTRLLSLPDELLTLIMLEMDLRAVTAVRQVCRRLHSIAKSNSIWRRLFVQCLGITIPQPFFLPMSLGSASSGDIETAMKKWKEDWQPSFPLQYFQRTVNDRRLPGCSILLETTLITPGGLWMIAGCTNGSVWCFSLDSDWSSADDLEPQLLIPSPFPDDLEEDTQVKIAVDFLSDMALGESSGSHTLLQFNIAVATCPTGDNLLPTHVDVWRVHVCREEGVHELKLGLNLSSFQEMGAELDCLSLHGSSVAYCIHRHLEFVAIVDWAEADGKRHEDGLLRWYIPHRRYSSIHLLPNDRILTIGGRNVALYNWRDDCPSSTRDLSALTLDYVLPTWYQELRGARFQADGLAAPLIMQGSVQIVLYALGYIRRIIIPLDDTSEDAIRTVSILETRSVPVKVAHLRRAFGHRQAVGFSGDFALTVVRYGDRDGTGMDGPGIRLLNLECPDLAQMKSPPVRLLYDEFSQRVVVTDAGLTYVLTLRTTNVR